MAGRVGDGGYRWFCYCYFSGARGVRVGGEGLIGHFLMTWVRTVRFAYSMRGTLRLEMFEIFRCEKDVAYGHFSSQNLFTMKSTDN